MDIGNFRVSVRGILDDLDIVVANDKSDNLICTCPFHEDRSPSFAIHCETGQWLCYSGCGQGGIRQLVARVLDLDMRRVHKWLEERGERLGDRDAAMALVFGEPTTFADPGEVSLFYEMGTTYQYMLNRGFTPETLKAWDVGKDTNRRAVVVPIRFNQELKGLIYCYIDRVPGRNPYEYAPPSMKKSHLLFGWDMLEDAPDRVVVVEGSLDALWLSQHGYQSVAILGNRISKEQVDLLVRRTRTIVLALDSDGPGQYGTELALKALTGRLQVLVAQLPPGRKDVQECQAGELSLTLDNVFSGSIFGRSEKRVQWD